MTGLYTVLVLLAQVVICVFIIWIQAKRIKTYKAENAALCQANRDAAARLEHIREYIAKNKTITEAANAELKELAGTADGDLVRRANNLFGGVREPDGGGANGT